MFKLLKNVLFEMQRLFKFNAILSKTTDSQIEILFKSIDRFIASIDTLEEFRVLGGDPFMNKEMHKIIRKLTTYDKVKKIAVYTNARIIPKGENLSV